jgi:DNA-binding winged helix-turn-helix (wHTH) protein/tetratricopeptide (TPR) repeat protein
MDEHASPVAYRCGAYTIIPAERRLLRGQEALELEAKVFDLILLLLEHRDRTLDKPTLTAALWGRRPVTDTALSQLVHKARRVLDDDGDRQTMIRTVYGRGLQWVAPTEPVPASAPVRADVEAAVLPAAEPAPEPAAVAAPVPSSSGAQPIKRSRIAAIAALLAVVVLSAVAFALLRPRAAAPSALPRLAMLPIENATGDAALDWTRHGLPGLMGSLLGESGSVDVGDTLQVAKAWTYTATGNRSEAERLRYATGAAILVAGRLRKLSGDLYELGLHVDGGSSARSGDIVVTAAQPATLGVDAVPRLLHLLELQAPAAPARPGLHGDAYLAQTFARGVDLATRGDWPNAKTYFALCVQNAPDFLPARLRLGEAQANTRDFAASGGTFRALVEEARRGGQPAIEAAALIELAENEFRRGDRSAALELLRSAQAPAERGGDPDAQARLALLAARAQAILGHPDLAAEELARGRALVERHALRQRKPLLHYAEEQIAEMRRDYPAQEAAARAALTAAEAIGDEHMAISETYRLGRMHGWQEQPFVALPLLARAWQRARERQMLDIEVVGGVELIWVLVETGLYDEACAVADMLVAETDAQPNAYWKAVATAGRARCQRTRGDATAALASYRAALPLINPDEDPQLAALVLEYEALAAFAVERAALPGILARLEALAGGRHAETYKHSLRLTAALAAAGSGDLESARAHLQEEAADPDRDDGQGNELRRVALHIATATGSAAVAAIALRDPALADSNDVEVLRLYARWAEQHGDDVARQRAEARQTAQRRDALAALRSVDFAAPPARGD